MGNSSQTDSFDPFDKDFPRMTRIPKKAGAWALVTLCVVTAGLLWLDSVAQEYRTYRAEGELHTSQKHCERLAHELTLPSSSVASPATNSVGQAAIIAGRFTAVQKAHETCLYALASQRSFKGLQPSAKPPAIAAMQDFFFSSESIGGYLYKMLLALLYAAFLTSLAILVVFVVESKLVAGKPIAEATESLRKWITAGTGGGGAAATMASLVAPIALAVPIIFGATLALRADPVDLKLAANEVPINLRTRIDDSSHGDLTLRRTVSIEIEPIVKSAGNRIELPISIKPVVEKQEVRVPVGPLPKGATTNQSITVSMPTLEQRLSESITLQNKTNAHVETLIARPPAATVSTQGVEAKIAELNATQRLHVTALTQMNEELKAISLGEKASIKAGGLLPR